MAFDIERLYELGARAKDVPEGRPFRGWRLRALSGSEFEALGGKERLCEAQLGYLAACALLAPTTHNTVPQRFRLLEAEGALGLALDRTAVLAASDPTGRQAMVSLGCALSNAAIAAEALGWSAEVALAPGGGEKIRPLAQGEARYVDAATVRFSRGPAKREPKWLEAMLRRKVQRAEYDERAKLPPGLADAATKGVAACHPGLTLHLLADAATRLFFGKFQELADSTVINRAAFARELGDWLLPNDSDSAVGMRGREFGLSDDVARRMHVALLGQERLLPDEASAFAKAGNLGMRSASAVAVITCAHDDAEHRVAAGRAYEELALRLTLEGFSTAVHAAITEVEAPNMALRGRLRILHRPTVVFRIGKPLLQEDVDRPHASRPALEDVLLPG